MASEPRRGVRLLITCEHGGNLIPAEYAALFKGKRRLLHSHRGWDPGALEMAGRLAATLQAPLCFGLVSRLVVDLNRSLGSPGLLSEQTRALPQKTLNALIDRHYQPYRAHAERNVRTLAGHGRVVHVSVHTFTPVLRGVRREVDIGLLYDPARPLECAVVRAWSRALRAALPRLRVRLNAPYRGTDDGLTTHLRTLLPGDRYAGIEIEVNQRFKRGSARAWRGIVTEVCRTLGSTIGTVGLR